MVRLTLCLELALGLAVAAGAARADVSACACDVKNAESLKARECSLCAEAEKHPADVPFFTLKDTNPRKSHRTLILPRAHTAAGHPLDQLSRAERTALWKFAISTAKERYGDNWGLAYNSWHFRTQCHLHFHAGDFIRAAENSNFKLVKRVEDFPAPPDSGIWVHPAQGGYHVHAGERVTEWVLVR